ncbi:MAG: cytochrome c biogenesis protein CcdA [Chloroflexi bacterium]|nr:cytochrome c biogenesis protein CcdA [Chloroflexota bacterium]
MNDLVPEVSLAVAFGAGLISFLSPCVAPLVPGYLSFISGVSIQDLDRRDRGQLIHVFLSCILFVIGFSIVFVLLGVSASLFGGLMDAFRRPLNQAAGAMMVLMGLFVMGIINVPMMFQEKRFHIFERSFGKPGIVLLGMAFGFGWTPCVGPILASILFYASTTATAQQGALLLSVYALGLGIPFIAAGLFFTQTLAAMGWVKRNYRLINALSGGLLVVIGVLYLTNQFFYLNLLAQRLYYMVMP